jgi:1-acyl-sn-glycerol-3-phosphate acyltransferase
MYPTDANTPSQRNQWALLKTRRFAPFFWTQFSGAFNDNLFKTALAVLLTYAASAGGEDKACLMVNLAAGLFIAPFFLFSPLAGQLADKFEKSMLIRYIKLAEVVIMGAAGLALLLNWPYVLLALLFAMGAQSAFFGPVKYSLLPQHLASGEMVGGNGLVEMGTFVAILLGTMAGGALIVIDHGRLLVAVAVVLAALIGWWVSNRIPAAPAAAPELVIDWGLIRGTRRTWAAARADRPVFLAIVGTSWFWFIGAAYLTQLPLFARDVLHCEAGVISLLLALFSVGIAIGSLLCERLSGPRVNLGLIPLGALGMSLFGFDLMGAYAGAATGAPLSMGAFIAAPGAWRVLLDLTLIGLFGGLYVVPLFVFIQVRTPAPVRSRIIAANNMLNALFMVASAGVGALLLGLLEMPIPHLFGLLALANLLAALCIYARRPFHLLRTIIWTITRLLYRVRYEDLAHIPEQGAAVLVCNHVSYVDALLIYAASPRPVRFVMHASYYNMPVLHRLFKAAGMIPIDSGRSNPTLLRQSMEAVAAALAQGDLICLFPEGRLTRDGEIDAFRPGIERILQANPVPVVPLALRGLWGSVFSHKGGTALTRRPKRFWSRIELAAGEIVQPWSATAESLRAAVLRLRGARG